MELTWSRWFRCESSFGLLLVPAQPGIFALSEEIVQPAGPNSRRMLAVFEINDVDNLARGLSRLFAPGSRWLGRLKGERCYVRYAVAPEPETRRAAVEALKNWLNSQMEAAAQVFEHSARRLESESEAATVTERAVDRVMSRPLFPAGF
jgi:hypothetical protein